MIFEAVQWFNSLKQQGELFWNQCILGLPQNTSLPIVLNPPPPPPPVGPQLPGGSLSSNPLGRKEHEAEAACSACVRALSSCS